MNTILTRAGKSLRPAFAGVAVFSAVINVLALSGSLYMLQVYDRVLTSRSLPTLIGLSLLVLAAYLLQGALEAIRGRMLSRIGARFDELVGADVYDLSMDGAGPDRGWDPLRALDHVRNFLSGLGPTALFDMPFMPLFLVGCFLLHPLLGWLAAGGGAVIVAFTLLTDALSRRPARDAGEAHAERQTMLEAARRNATVVRALGMSAALRGRFLAANGRLVTSGLRASDVASSVGSAAKTARMVLQSAGLGLGAYLVIREELSGGAMIASSILMSRALAPIETAVAHWRGFLAARRGYTQLAQAFAARAQEADRVELPAPREALIVENVVVTPPGSRAASVNGVSFRLGAGQALGLVGPSASGKSSLARALVGGWPIARGDIRLDGAALNQWPAEALGRHVGYLPQDVELFDGSVAENIARFAADARHEEIVAAARVAGAHDMIVRLADGYNTPVGPGGRALSGGQRQRIALARALFRDPFLVVLDEPNAHLDAEGDAALTGAVEAIRGRGGVLVLITHRPSALRGVDFVGVLDGGRLRALGPRDEVLRAATPAETIVPFKTAPQANQARS